MTHRHRFLIFFLLLTSIPAPRPAMSTGADDNDPGTSIERALEQRLQPEYMAGAIIKLVQSADYKKAEDILSDMLISKPLDIDGYRLLEKIYALLSFTRDVRYLDKWCEASPSSHFPFMIRGMHYYERARVLDGANQALLLDEKQRRNFNIFSRKAQTDLLKAWELNPDAPGPPAALAALSIQLKQHRSVMEQWFARGIAADPAWLGSYQAKLMYLAPWRYGSDQLMAQFALQCFEEKQPERNTFIITLDWIKLRSDRLGTSVNGIRFLTGPDIYSLLSKGLDRYIDAFPLSPRIDAYGSLHERVIGQPYVSIAAFSDTLLENPDNTEVLRGRIAAYLASKQTDEAKADIEMLEQLEGPTPYSRAGRAAVLHGSNRAPDRAAFLYDQAIADETSSYRRKHYLLKRAEMNRSYGRLSQAVDDFSAAISEDILFEDAYLGRAQSHYAQGNLDAALADLVILKSSIRGRLATHARSLINTYMKTERDRLAGRNATVPRLSLQKDTTRQTADPAKTAETAKYPADNAHREHLIRGLHRYYQKDYETARRDFYRTIASNPAGAQAYFMLGTIAEQVDLDHAKARVYFEHAFRLEPDNQDYLLGVSNSRYRDRDFSAALQSLSDYLDDKKKPPGDPQTRARLYFLRALCLEELALIPEALRAMQEALRLDPQLEAATVFIDDHTVESMTPNIAVQPIQYISHEQRHPADELIQRLLEKGRNSIREGDAVQARISFLKVIRLNPAIGETFHQLGRISFEFDHDYTEARRYYSQAIEKDPGNPQYYFDRAVIHYYFRQYGPAIADFTRALDLQPNHELSIYYRGVSNHMLGNTDAARMDFNSLRRSGSKWDVEIDRFRNAWSSEIEQFLNPVTSP